MSANDEIENAIIRHQIMLLRYARGRELAAEKAITAMLEDAIGLLPSAKQLNSRQLQRLIDEIIQSYNSNVGIWVSNNLAEMQDFADEEMDFNYKTLNKFSNIEATVPDDYAVLTIIGAKAIQMGTSGTFTIREALSKFGATKAVQVMNTVREAFLGGQTAPSVAATLLQMLGTQKSQAATLARTITNHVASQIRRAFMSQNKEYISSYKWIATLDSRTSLICASRDQKIYEDIENNPKPPAHFNCRSTITYVLKDEYDLGLDIKSRRPAIGPNDDRGTVDSETSYESWLRRQPKSFQEDVLGQTRARLFRNGQYTLDKFVDRSGKIFTLEDLKRQDPLVFESLDL